MGGSNLAKAVGVGGIFLKAQDPQTLAAWYAKHLGIKPADDGSLTFDGPESAHLPLDTRYFGESPQTFMLNFRVYDLDGLLAGMEAAGVRIDPKREDHSYGRFAWIWSNCGAGRTRVGVWMSYQDAE